MAFDLTFEQGRLRRSTTEELLGMASILNFYGITISASEAEELERGREEALRRTGRLEFGGGVLKKLAYAFCDSPYVEASGFAELLGELQDSFYYYKNESEDALTDDEIIDYMKAVFDGEAGGSTEYLEGVTLEELCRKARFYRGRK